MVPEVVIRPMLLMSFKASVNQRFPSGPAEMPSVKLTVGTGNSVTAPVGVIRPILKRLFSVNQRFPSGPALIPYG